MTLGSGDLQRIRTVEVFDALGRTLLSVPFTPGSRTIDISALSDGAYHLRAVYTDGSIALARAVLQG